LRYRINPPTYGRGWSKPDHGTGLWTSTYTPGQLSGWIEWCYAEGYTPGWDRPEAFVLTPLKARIIVVDSEVDFAAVVERYLVKDSRYAETMLTPLNFSLMAEEYDAMHLTEVGQWRTRFGFSRNFNHSLYGWDCESTCWFRWKFADDVVHRKTADIIRECNPKKIEKL